MIFIFWMGSLLDGFPRVMNEYNKLWVSRIAMTEPGTLLATSLTKTWPSSAAKWWTLSLPSCPKWGRGSEPWWWNTARPKMTLALSWFAIALLLEFWQACKRASSQTLWQTWWQITRPMLAAYLYIPTGLDSQKQGELLGKRLNK